ncbi:MAG: type II toxin-antitoxin system HicA family toxin [Sulfuricellaceae bacterium]|nr:type II toxin-antitoxin system HicA family toxin [Sulfuricellaceae bacterium]
MKRQKLTPPLVNWAGKLFAKNERNLRRQSKGLAWVLDRINGNHHIMTKDDCAVPVPVHGKRDLGEGLISALQRQTGVKLK